MLQTEPEGLAITWHAEGASGLAWVAVLMLCASKWVGITPVTSVVDGGLHGRR
jgi:hypothetical protein